MKLILKLFLFLFSLNVFACGNYEWEDGMSFYNLFLQTNIAAEEYYPFLRDDTKTFYGEDYYEMQQKINAQGNIKLWEEVLTNWTLQQIEDAIYHPGTFFWNKNINDVELSAKKYIEFAQHCSNQFAYRAQWDAWDYDEIVKKNKVDHQSLLIKANALLSKETHPQLQARYYYQIIRIMHYAKNWDDAIRFFETKIENKLQKNEIYFYILDQVAGCYYSVGKYEKAAYIFTKVVNNSLDRKKSAYLSFNFCTYKGAQGKSFFNGVEDEKDLLLITGLRDFSNKVSNIKKLIKLDANDPRLELLFMRALNAAERQVWEKNIGFRDGDLPSYKEYDNHLALLEIAEMQSHDKKIKNKDFWKFASSYLSFINQDIPLATRKLKDVKGYPEQKEALSIIYEVFSWKRISIENEDYLKGLLTHYFTEPKFNEELNNNIQTFILDKIAHVYYKNNQIAKAFLVHNEIGQLTNLASLKLLNSLEKLYNKPNKSDYEKMLLTKDFKEESFMDYINESKGIYYLQHKNPKQALVFFQKINEDDSGAIPDMIFSNNIKECFHCEEADVMEDEVYKANVFSFIKNSFSLKELSQNLLTLEELTHNKKQWKAKLANYLLGNYYFNISNTGYYRGILTGNTNCCEYTYIGFVDDELRNSEEDSYFDEMIKDLKGYNLSSLYSLDKYYFEMSNTAMQYYNNVLKLSTDRELNARCLYLMAKCELNDFYNNGSGDTYEMKTGEYGSIDLPFMDSFKQLKTDYSDTKFNEMILQECSYYRYYSNNY